MATATATCQQVGLRQARRVGLPTGDWTASEVRWRRQADGRTNERRRPSSSCGKWRLGTGAAVGCGRFYGDEAGRAASAPSELKMTQGKKKKRLNRSVLLAKKIIIKDGGTVR